MNQKQMTCPVCHQSVGVRHNGTEQSNDRTSPWIFVEHDRDDERAGTVFRYMCPGSNGNDWTAANSW